VVVYAVIQTFIFYDDVTTSAHCFYLERRKKEEINLSFCDLAFECL
jgi:hypothetical protein